jgi:hypothetical protein
VRIGAYMLGKFIARTRPCSEGVGDPELRQGADRGAGLIAVDELGQALADGSLLFG